MLSAILVFGSSQPIKDTINKKSLNKFFQGIHVLLITRLVFSRLFYFRVNLGNMKEKPIRNLILPSNEAPTFTHLYLAKFCWVAFPYCRRNLYCIFIIFVKSFKSERLA